jgi:YhcG PDDEXK nuclease domain/Type II intron maturase
MHRAERVKDDEFTIINRYQSEYRGVMQYYLLAENVHWLGKLHWVMRASLLKTLANKYKTRVVKLRGKYSSQVLTPYGPRMCLEVRVEREGKPTLVARFGGIVLRRDKEAVLRDQKPFTTALLDHLQEFLLELGKGFSFVARQQRITLEGDHFHVDLVLYNRLLRAFVLIDLKVGRLTRRDIGQMQM